MCKSANALNEQNCETANAKDNIFVGMSEKTFIYLELNLKIASTYAQELRNNMAQANAIFNYWNTKNTTPNQKKAVK
jgi:hypothetical protein